MIIEIISNFIRPFLKDYGIIISFLGGFVTGESGILSLSFLSANGFIPLWYVLIFSTLGMYLSDFVPFTIGRFKFLRDIFEGKRFSKHLKKAEKIMNKYTKNNLFLIILYAKFTYGASIPVLLYLGHKKTSYKKFAFYNIFVELIFVPLLVFIGWYAGKGFNLFLIIFKNIKFAIFILIVLIIFLFFLRKWVNQRLIKMQKQ